MNVNFDKHLLSDIEKSPFISTGKFLSIYRSLDYYFDSLPEVDLVIEQTPRPHHENDVWHFFVGDIVEEHFLRDGWSMEQYFTPIKYPNATTSTALLRAPAMNIVGDRHSAYRNPKIKPFEERSTEVWSSFTDNGPDYLTETKIGKPYSHIARKIEESIDEASLEYRQPGNAWSRSVDEYYNKLRDVKILFCPMGHSPVTRRLFEGWSVGALCVTPPISDVEWLVNPIDEKTHIEASTIDEYVDEIKYYIDNPTEAKKIAQRGHEFWKTWFKPNGKYLNKQLMALQYEQFLRAEEISNNQNI